MKNVFELTDEALNGCASSEVNVSLIRKILEKNDMVADSGYINVDEFAQWFAHYLESQIGAPVDTDEWDNIWDENYDEGESIAENINELLDQEE